MGPGAEGAPQLHPADPGAECPVQTRAASAEPAAPRGTGPSCSRDRAPAGPRPPAEALPAGRGSLPCPRLGSRRSARSPWRRAIGVAEPGSACSPPLRRPLAPPPRTLGRGTRSRPHCPPGAGRRGSRGRGDAADSAPCRPRLGAAWAGRASRPAGPGATEPRRRQASAARQQSRPEPRLRRPLVVTGCKRLLLQRNRPKGS